MNRLCGVGAAVRIVRHDRRGGGSCYVRGIVVRRGRDAGVVAHFAFRVGVWDWFSCSKRRGSRRVIAVVDERSRGKVIVVDRHVLTSKWVFLLVTGSCEGVVRAFFALGERRQFESRKAGVRTTPCVEKFRSILVGVESFMSRSTVMKMFRCVCACRF